MFEKDNEIKAYALDMWANVIETGTPTLSAKDAEEQGLPFKALSSEQMEFVLRIRKLATDELFGERKKNVIARPDNRR